VVLVQVQSKLNPGGKRPYCLVLSVKKKMKIYKKKKGIVKKKRKKPTKEF
jgi:hypothetical protein